MSCASSTVAVAVEPAESRAADVGHARGPFGPRVSSWYSPRMGNIGPGELLFFALLAMVAAGTLVLVRKLSSGNDAPARREPSPPNPPPAPAERLVEREKIIERQVLVTHCRFCNALTPVDLSACKHCGGQLR